MSGSMDEANPSPPTGHSPYEHQDDGPPAAKRQRPSFTKSLSSRHAEQAALAADGAHALSSDPLDYPRRRAIIACEVCRSRKSRCDGGKPKCKLCTELKAECVYREPGVKLDAGDKLILERLAHIEGLLQSNLLHSPMGAGGGGPISPATSNTASEDMHSKRISHSGASMPMPMTGIGISLATNISTMPKAHTTPALHLLQWPLIRDLVSKQCDPQVLMQLEMTRPPLDLQPPYSLDLSDKVPSYARAFFDRVNVWYAVVSPYTWHAHYRTASSVGFRSGAESCVVLLVLALGQAAYAGQSISTLPADAPIPGQDYFNAAWAILPSMLLQNSVLSTQCHILAAAYLLYIVRPLEAWNLLSSASMKLQLLLSSPTTIPPSLKELSERIYWNALLLESDLLAELDLPHSGIVSFEETMRLPRSFQFDATSTPIEEQPPPGTDDLWYFLAEIALRRLLNRVSHTIYSQQNSSKRSTASTSLTALEPLVSELDFQLTQWYENLPPSIRFPRDAQPIPTSSTSSSNSQIQTVLRLRYFACRTIIFRPYVQAVLSTPDLLSLEPNAASASSATLSIRASCEKCLDACLRQLENIRAHHEGHLPYLWQGALSITSQTLLLMGATLSPVLRGLLLPTGDVDAVIEEVVAEVERLGNLAPSLRLCAEIIREAEERRQVLMQRPV